MQDSTYQVKRFHPLRRATIGILDAASKKHMIHALIEVDVSRPRELIRQYKAQTGETLSFTSYLIHAFARAIDRNRHMQAYRDWRNRLILFDEVDVSTTIERDLGERKQVLPYVVRAANTKPLIEIHREIRAAQSRAPEQVGAFPLMRLYLALPLFVRGFFCQVMDRFPVLMKENVGTVMLTAVGMFGSGGGWGIPVATHTTNITVGGIVHRPVLRPDGVKNHEHLCLTASFDHDIIDGAPAARFMQRLQEIVIDCTSLESLVT
jgi:pyruvate/2-oxoglutarate dehydrogenase complex dihydrolipoamide acyltransferase (E2) component